jgi:hypothetical protein
VTNVGVGVSRCAGLLRLSRHPQPLLRNLQPALFVERFECPLGLLPTLVGAFPELVYPRSHVPPAVSPIGDELW